MRILFLQQQPCVRALKYSVALRGALPGIALGFAYQGKTLSEWYGSGDELFERWWNLGEDPAKTLQAVVDEFRPDLIHSHNLPDSLTAIALELFADRIPVVHDVHDLQSLRRTPYEDGFPEPRDTLALEQRAIEHCSALVAVSEELLDEIRSRYRATAPTLAFPNYALRRDLPPVLAPARRRNGQRPRIVYQGTLSTNGGHYDLREIFRSIVREGVSLDVYPSRPVPAYAELANGPSGLRLHSTLPLRRAPRRADRLRLRLGRLQLGAQRRAPRHLPPEQGVRVHGVRLARPDPATPCALTSRRRGLLGVSLTTLDDLAGQLAAIDVVEVRRRIASARLELTVEANIHRLIELYESVS